MIREYCHIIGVLNHAVRKGILLKSPAVGIRLPKKTEHRERVATEEEIQKLVAAVGWCFRSGKFDPVSYSGVCSLM